MYNKMKNLSIPVSPEVAGFAVVMEAKLQMEGYDNVEAWENIPLPKLMQQLEAKAKRLAAADPTDANALFTKAVVVGSLAMMIAEKAAKAKEAVCSEDTPAYPMGTVIPMQVRTEAPVAEPTAPSGVTVSEPEAEMGQSADAPQQFRHRVRTFPRRVMSS